MNEKLFDYSSHIVPYPNKVEAHNESSNIVVIDSNDRNKNIFNNSNNYTITFPSVFKDVSEIELISIYYKYSNYELDQSNNKIFITNINNERDIEITIPKGNYKTDELESIFSKVYSNLSLNYAILIKFSSILNRFYFIIDSTDIYSVNFKGLPDNVLTNLYSDNRDNVTSEDSIFKYKEKTNGRYFGFSENNFTNKPLIDKLNMVVTQNNNNNYDHVLSLIISDNKSYSQLVDTLNMYDSDLKLIISISPEEEYHINNIKINNDYTIKFIIYENKIDIMVTLAVDLSNKFNSTEVLNPTIYTNIIIGDIIRTKDRDKYVLIDIKEFDRLVSINDNIHNSYVKIPVDQSEHQYFDNAKIHGTIKYFDPIMASLDRLTIQIKDRDGTILEDNGLNHTMVFSVKCLNDKKNYT
jgi:hypothetical protein